MLSRQVRQRSAWAPAWYPRVTPTQREAAIQADVDRHWRVIPSPDEENPSPANPASSSLEPPSPLRFDRFRSLRLGITGIHRPSEGTIRFKGEPITRLRPDQIARRGISRTFQIVQPFPEMSVVENVAAAAL